MSIDVENVVELRSGHDPLGLVPREIPPTDWQRYEANVAEIFERLVRLFARRFTVQERMGEKIGDTLVQLIEAQGVAVHLEASHLCTLVRGVEEHSRTTTTFWRGGFRDAELRREFLDEVRARSPR